MEPLVIGEPGSRIILSPRDGKAVVGWLALARFEVGAVVGDYQIELVPGGRERWHGRLTEELENMHACLTGEAHLGSLEDELRMDLSCSPTGKVAGRAAMRLLPVGDDREPVLSFRINIDQSYLPEMIASARKNFPGI